eukprot:1157499-Pelagomonas_calceolata.AAC.4
MQRAAGLGFLFHVSRAPPVRLALLLSAMRTFPAPCFIVQHTTLPSEQNRSCPPCARSQHQAYFCRHNRECHLTRAAPARLAHQAVGKAGSPPATGSNLPQGKQHRGMLDTSLGKQIARL